MENVVINPEFKKVDYRVVRNKYPSGKEYYSIHECWYDNDGPIAITARALKPKGDTVEELKKELSLFSGAFEKQVIDFSFFLTDEEKAEIKDSSGA